MGREDPNESEAHIEPSPLDLPSTAPIRPQREIFRPRLAPPESLRTGEIGLAVLFAPAGYGKSTVMASWRDALDAEGMACCWLNLRNKHCDPKTLFRALLKALQNRIPGQVFELTERNLRSATSYLIEPLLVSLLDELTTLDQRIVIFMDEVENLAESPGKKALELLIEHRPENLSLVLSGRNAQQLGLTKYRLAGHITELRTKDLCFTLEETETLLKEHFGLKVNTSTLDLLAEKTEGWPAALSLYALGKLAGTIPSDSLHEFSSASGELADYLGEILLASLDAPSQDLLMRAAVPDHFSIELLQQLVPDQDPVQALERIRETSLFLQTVDSAGKQYRFHSLCADFLRRRLQQSNAKLYKELLRLAGDWYWTHDHPYEAVNCAKSAEDWSLMAERIAELADPMVRGTGEFDTYLQWLRELPEGVLKTQPQLFVHQTWALGFSREIAQAEIALRRLAAILPDLPEDQAHKYRRQLELYRFIIEAIMDRADPHLNDMLAWLKRYPDASEEEKVLVYGAIPAAARNRNKLGLALEFLEKTQSIYQKMGSDYALSWVHNIRLSVLIKSGNFVDARTLGDKGLKVICETLGDKSPPAGMSNVMLAYLAYEKGDTEAARNHLDNGMRFIANQGVVEPLYFAHLTQSWLASDDGNEKLSQAILLEGEQLGISYQLPRLTTQLATRRAIHLLHEGDQAAADAVIRSRQLLNHPDDIIAKARQQCAELLRVNMDLLQGRFREAAVRAKSMSKAAAANGCMRMKAEYDFLLAIALQKSGDLNKAGRRFHALLAQAAEQEHYGFMLRYGSLGRGLIAEQYKIRQKTWGSGAKLDAADRVLKTLAGASGLLQEDAAQQVDTSLLEALTKREVDILRRAARTGLNNRKLAEALFLSEGTLKWHLHNIYSKLDVGNRTGAIAQAQRLGLLNSDITH